MIGKHLTYGQVFCAVEHVQTDLFFSLQLAKEKKELAVKNEIQFSSKPALFTHLKSQKHVFLIINNQHVLLKKTTTQHADKEQHVKAAFPSVKTAEFYYEMTQHKENTWVAICRKSYIDQLIEEYKKHGISVVGFSLHNLAITALLPYIKQRIVSTSNCTISISNQEIDGICSKESHQKRYSINDLSISNEFMLGLSGIVSYFYNNSPNTSNFTNLEKKLKETYKSYQLYSLGFKTALGVLFSILLINFLIFSNAHSSMNRMEKEILIKSSAKNRLLQLKNRVAQKMELTKNMSSLSSSKTTWYINELGKSVPASIQLTSLIFQPKSTSIKKNKEILVQKNSVLIKGISKTNLSFSNWTSELERQDWVEEIVIVSHGKGKKRTSSFELNLKLKE